MSIPNKIDTIVNFQIKKPLTPTREYKISDEEIAVSILPGLLICPNLKQQFVPIEKLTFFNCKEDDCFYFVIDGDLERSPVSINSVSIQKSKVKEDSEEKINPYFISLAKIVRGEDGELEVNPFGYNYYKQWYLFVSSYKISDDDNEEKYSATTFVI